MKWISLIILSLALMISGQTRAEDRVVFLLRHAEKASSTDKDPSLSARGQERARDLVARLHGIPLTGLITSQFARTQATLAPLAEERQLPLQIMPLGQDLSASLTAISSKVLTSTGNWVIAGHSNTLAPLIKAFGGPEIADLDEGEYDKLFQLTLSQGQVTGLVVSRYGEPSATEEK